MSSTNSTILSSVQENSDNKELQAYNQLKRALDSRMFPSGTIMSERKLSEAYKMSRTPIRAALKQLTFEGLLKFVPEKGVIVPEYTIEDILEVYELMETLQLYAVRRCIQKLNYNAIENLGLILDNMENALKSKDLNNFVIFDIEFHAFLISHSANERLIGFYMPLDNQSSQFKATVSEEISQAERSYHEHVVIYNSILSKNIIEAGDAIKVHYQNIIQYHIDKLVSRIF